MKRVNLLEYFELAEMLSIAKRAATQEKANAGSIYFATFRLPPKLLTFAQDDNGFSACKHVANELANSISAWGREHLYNDKGEFAVEKFDQELFSYQYSDIGTKIESFRHVFEAESRDVDVYSVGQISIYKTSALVSGASEAIPKEARGVLPQEAMSEFDNAGRCLAFDLPTACGFHALRGMELVMDCYLNSYGQKTGGFKTWNDYIKAATDVKHDATGRKPSDKVTAMLDRMRSLDRNPLMHPRDTLDLSSADMLFRLSTITAVEMAKDMGPEMPKLGNALAAVGQKKMAVAAAGSAE